MTVLIKLIKVYQLLVSPLLGNHCRFYPTCSEYFKLSLEKYGTLKGFSKTIIRILKCNRWSKGGIDLP